MARTDIEKAVKHFGVPADKEEYLFLLPGFYVGAADGNLDAKEVIAIVKGGAIALEIVGRDVMEPQKIVKFLADKTVSTLRQCNLDDVDILMKGIREKLTELPSDKANMIKGMIRVVIVLVAAISGRKKWILWGSRVDKSESQMIARIASYL
jgi:hypothetical protein